MLPILFNEYCYVAIAKNIMDCIAKFNILHIKTQLVCIF